MAQNQHQRVTKCRNASIANLQQYANNKRLAGQFNDVIVLAEGESIPANRLVLACYSKFFESMFLSSMKEQYENKVEIKKFDGKIIRIAIDYIYSGKLDIDIDNAMDILAVADFLQVDGMKQFCFEFLESNVTIDNCLEIVKLSSLYHFSSLTEATFKLISDNFAEITQTDMFKNISEDDFASLIVNLDPSRVQQSSLFNAILNWTQRDESRRTDFTKLFLKLDLSRLSFQFLESVVVKESLVKCELKCVTAVMTSMFAKLKVDDSKFFKILCVNGVGSRLVFEVYSLTENTSKVYPQVPNKPSNHCLVKLDDYVYSIGGNVDGNVKTNKAYRLNVTESDLQWKEIQSMSENRDKFGATAFHGYVVANGGSVGSKTTEIYDAGMNQWRNIAASKHCRYAGHTIVVAEKALYALGGYDRTTNETLSSVETLSDLNGQWKYVQSMKTPRYYFAAVTCLGFVYAIGGYYTNGVGKTVEKYDPRKDTWTNVSSLNIERQHHAACVIQGKIYVIGGKNAAGRIEKSIECYEPELDRWTILGETKQDCSDHAVVAL